MSASSARQQRDEAAHERVSQGAPRLEHLRVLCVDDDESARLLLALMLEPSGATVTIVASACQTLEALRRSSYDVLVSDIRMPQMDGCALLAAVRALPPPQRDIPAIALTADTGEEIRARTRAAGFQTHLTKPVTDGELVDAIARLTIERD
jgi:CheY-like chemotaxis protein